VGQDSGLDPDARLQLLIVFDKSIANYPKRGRGCLWRLGVLDLKGPANTALYTDIKSRPRVGGG
jgi:hypothetical protein